MEGAASKRHPHMAPLLIPWELLAHVAKSDERTVWDKTTPNAKLQMDIKEEAAAAFFD